MIDGPALFTLYGLHYSVCAQSLLAEHGSAAWPHFEAYLMALTASNAEYAKVIDALRLEQRPPFAVIEDRFKIARALLGDWGDGYVYGSYARPIDGLWCRVAKDAVRTHDTTQAERYAYTSFRLAHTYLIFAESLDSEEAGGHELIRIF